MARNGGRGGYNNCNIPLLPPLRRHVYSGEYGLTTTNFVASWDYSFVPNLTRQHRQQFLVPGQQGQRSPLVQPTYELDPNLALVSVNPLPGTSSEQMQPSYYLIQRLETANIMGLPNVEHPGLIPPIIPERLWEPTPAINMAQLGNVPQGPPQQEQPRAIPLPPPKPPTRYVSIVVPVAPERKHLFKGPLIVSVPVIAREVVEACSSPPDAGPCPGGKTDEGIQRPPRPMPEQETTSSEDEGRSHNQDQDVPIPTTHAQCKFCTSNGEVRQRASSHVLRDDDGKVQCPVLRAHVCQNCGATGDFAHTARYCPQRGQLQTGAAVNTGEEGEQNRPNNQDDDRYVHLRSSAGGYVFQKY